MVSHRWVGVVPSLRRDIDDVETLRTCLLRAGVEPIFVITGRELDEGMAARGLARVSPGQNPGFGSTVEIGARAAGDWDWMLVVNDDLRFQSEGLRSVMEYLEAGFPPGTACLGFLDPEPRRPIPGLLDTWRNLALMPPRSVRVDHVPYYKSFSLVAVSRPAWDILDGFDESITYTFEDADFACRAHDAGVSVVDVPLSSLNHEKSGTSRNLVAAVLPVSADSARAFLVSRGHRPVVAALAVASALVARLGGAGLRSNRRAHLLGIGCALRAVVSRRRPTLPSYEES